MILNSKTHHCHPPINQSTNIMHTHTTLHTHWCGNNKQHISRQHYPTVDALFHVQHLKMCMSCQTMPKHHRNTRVNNITNMLIHTHTQPLHTNNHIHIYPQQIHHLSQEKHRYNPLKIHTKGWTLYPFKWLLEALEEPSYKRSQRAP